MTYLHVSFAFDWESDSAHNFELFLQDLQDNHKEDFLFTFHANSSSSGFITPLKSVSEAETLKQLEVIAQKHDVDLVTHVLNIFEFI